MSYLLFKLAFDAPVHFGPSDSALSLYTSEDFFRADTLFSALCHTAGDELDRLVKSVQNDCLRFSDAMPWRGDTLFLPKPCFSVESASDISPELRKKQESKKTEMDPRFRHERVHRLAARRRDVHPAGR